jgi:hypothetical protein
VSSSIFVRSSSCGGVEGGAELDSPLVSSDLLRESPRETRCLLREELSSLL